MSALTARLRPLNPVLARELKQRMRGRHTWIVITLYLGVLAAILRWIYVVESDRNSLVGGFDLLASATIGRAIFQWLLFFILLLVCFIVPGLTAGAISGERERQTLVSLQITLLRPRSIVAGKLLASLAFVVLLVVASVPLVTIPFLLGGVSVSEMVKGLVMVVATAVTLACIALACSAVLRRTQAATVVAYGLTAALVLGTMIVYGAQQIPRRGVGPRPAPWVLALNPFAATADVVAGRNTSGVFESPFRPLRDLLLLDENERLSQVVSGQGDQIIVRGGSGPATAIAPPARPAPVFVGPNGPGIPPAPGLVQVGVAPGSTERVARLGGIRFWVVSLTTWVVVAGLAVALAVRRISLPRATESS